MIAGGGGRLFEDSLHQIVTCMVMCVGCDVLWGGCPMVTLPLERMASRVAASLCYATGLGPEMVVSSQKEYEVWPKLHLPLTIIISM